MRQLKASLEDNPMGLLFFLVLFLGVCPVSMGADCNLNGIEDSHEVLEGQSEDCDGNGTPDQCDVKHPISGSERTQLLLDSPPLVVLAADFDGDGDPDLVSGNEGGTISLLLNAGERQFEAPSTHSAGGDIVYLESDDLNGDGKLDLVVGRTESLSVLLGQTGGGFADPVRYRNPGGTGQALLTDVNRDGAPDLIAVKSPSSLSVYLNNADDTGALTASDDIPVASQPTHVAGADINGDGVVDLVVGHRGAERLVALINDGSGRFSPARGLEFDDGAVHTVTTRDADGDGDTDLLVQTAYQITVLSNNGNGEFTVRSRLDFGLGRTLAGVAAEDLDGDGDIDMSVSFTAGRSLTLLLNDGTGIFGGAQAVNPGLVISATHRPRGLLAADFDGNGGAELVMLVARTRNIIIVLWSSDDALSFSQSDTYFADGPPHTTELGDLDGDGFLDVILGNRWPGGPGVVAWLRNRGDGTFDDAKTVKQIGIPFSIKAFDIDEDGDVDVVTANLEAQFLAVIENLGDSKFRSVAHHRTPGQCSHVEVADLNGDGALDLVSSNTNSNNISLFFREDGTRFRPAGTLASGSFPVATVALDIDGDLDFDLAVANKNSSDLAVLENIGGGEFAPPVSHPLPGAPSFAVAGDFDLDGNTDVATVSDVRRNVSILLNTNGDGNLGNPSVLSVGQVPYTMIAADMDSDGALDLITTNSAYDSVSILLNRRQFGAPIHISVGDDPRLAVAGDLDGDGDVDLVSSNREGRTVTVYLNETSAPITYLESVCTEAQFSAVSVSGGAFRERATKYTTPARVDPKLLDTVFQNTKRHALHMEFLAEEFPESFPVLTGQEFDQLVGQRATRSYYVGALERVRAPSGALYAFTVFADTGSSAGEALTLEEVDWVYQSLGKSFQLRPLAYRPDTELARQKAEAWRDPPFPVYFADGRSEVEFESYTPGTGYGRVRLLTLEEFDLETREGCFTSQDILVIEKAPRDVEGIVAGMVTAERQGPLSHLSIRLARRGTPNAYVPNALEAFAPYEGRLVRLDVVDTAYVVEDTTLAEAEKFWASQRPSLLELPGVDENYGGLDDLLTMDLSSGGDEGPESRYGGKASNFARLQRLLTGERGRFREPGFAIPMRYYVEFLRTNTIEVEGQTRTYEEYLQGLFDSAEFRSDCRLRQDTLADFRSFARQNSTLDGLLVNRLAARIPEVFGSTTRMVRFRSSSNMEDNLEFNGAGLYESTSVCAEDTIDPRSRDGSHCDPTRDNESTIERALKKVWTSLWTYRAVEERSFFQIPQDLSSMGILVSRAFLDERANGVAFTGNPTQRGDRRFLVTTQIGEESVVNPEPGVSVERALLEVVDGEVVEILRKQSSSLVQPGETVLTDEQLRELGAFMAFVDDNFPLRLDGHPREEVLLDFEFKIEPDGSLAVKQVRPFLITAERRPTFQLEIPPATFVCGVFSVDNPGREPIVEYQTKSVVQFHEGTFDLSTSLDTFSLDLIKEVRFGTDQAIAQPIPESPGEFQVTRIPGGAGETIYRFNYTQSFRLPGGESFEIVLFRLNFRGRGQVPVERTRVFEEDFLTSELAMEGRLDGIPVASYSSCGYDLLPFWELEVELAGGSSIHLEERFLPSENDLASGPASLVRATVHLEGTRQTVRDYWQLIYSARRHNRDERYWVVLDPPLQIANIESAVHVVEIFTPEPTRCTNAQVSYLGADFSVLARPQVVSCQKKETDPTLEVTFRRGDFTADGTIESADAVSLLQYLFLGGVAPTCEKAADVDDTGRLNITDAVWIVLRLFSGLPLPEPTGRCGGDPTPDVLPCESFAACE